MHGFLCIFSVKFEIKPTLVQCLVQKRSLIIIDHNYLILNFCVFFTSSLLTFRLFFTRNFLARKKVCFLLPIFTAASILIACML